MEIGGFFELELKRGTEFHTSAVKVNSGRNALKFILRHGNFAKVYLPEYVCSSLQESIQDLGVDHELYPLDLNFTPIFRRSLTAGESFLYVNYFGLYDHVVESLQAIHPDLIIDNSQAFFSQPSSGVESFYSPRKFFGVPDGGYAYSRFKVNPVERDQSFSRCDHLVRRLDLDATSAYEHFQKNEEGFPGMPVRTMSRLTQRLLENIDYPEVIQSRRTNFLYLHDRFESINLLSIDLRSESVPMVYPLVVEKPGLREHLIDHQIYVAQYWPEVLRQSHRGSHAYYMTTHLVPLPIDQRYTTADMERIHELIARYLD